MSTSEDARTRIVSANRDMYRGMLERDTELLDALLDQNYTLTHMTGYRQTRTQWLEQISTVEMRHHSAQRRGTSVEITGDTAVFVGQSIVDATIWGNRGTWNLQLTTTYHRCEGQWIALKTVATTF